MIIKIKMNIKCEIWNVKCENTLWYSYFQLLLEQSVKQIKDKQSRKQPIRYKSEISYSMRMLKLLVSWQNLFVLKLQNFLILLLQTL